VLLFKAFVPLAQEIVPRCLNALRAVAVRCEVRKMLKFVVNSCHGAPPRREMKMKGIVEELKLPPKGDEKEAAHLLVKNGTDTVDVYLCPKSFLEDMGVSYSKRG
jgi:hypothetical protein